MLAASSSLGQGAPKTHLDSVKEFFRSSCFSLGASGTPYLLKETVFSSYDSLLFLNDSTGYNFEMEGFKIWTRKCRVIGPIDYDSIVFSAAELAYLINQWQHPKIRFWTYDIFPDYTIVTKSEMDSFFKRKPYFKPIVQKGFERWFDRISSSSDTLRKIDPINVALSGSLDLCKLKKRGYLRFTDPVFIKKGTIAILGEYKYIAGTLTEFNIYTYRKDGVGWRQYFYMY